MLLAKDPSQRPAITSVKEFLHRLVVDREAIDQGRATLGQNGDVSPPPTMLLWATGARGAGVID